MDDKMRIRVFSLACFALAEVVLFFPSVLDALPSPDFMGPITVGLAVFSLLETLFPDAPPEQKKRTVFRKGELRRLVKARKVTSIACRGTCGVVYSRLFLRGDYFGKIIGTCPGCEGELYVRSIRKVPVKIV